MKIKNGRQKGTSILLLCLFALSPLLFAAPVKGQSTVLIEESEPMLEVWVENHTASQPYIAAYMTTDYIEANPGYGSAKAVRVTVSFSGTDKSVIQSDNWLTAGIAAQGPDSVHGGCNAIDWGYTFELMLAPWMHPDPFVHAEVYEGHEWVNCLPGYVKSIYCWNAIVPGLTVSSSVTLIMEWTEDTLDYYAKVGETNYLLLSYTPNETAYHYFMTGTVGRSWGGLPLPNTVKWLQFPGAWSNYNIGKVGWHSYLSYPGFIETGGSSWTDVSFAYSTDGPNSYWDNTAGWGGDPYEGVDANYCYKYIHFYPTSDGTTLKPDTLLWDPNPQVLNGGFETGNSLHWMAGGYGDHRVTSEDPHSGTYSMLIGYKYSPNVANARDWIYQSISIPAAPIYAQLSFYYHLFTEDSDYWNWFEVYIRNSSGSNPALVFKMGGINFPGLEEYGWGQVTYDVSSYAGQTIQLYFAVANWYDTLYKTWCYIDDVKLVYEIYRTSGTLSGTDDDYTFSIPSLGGTYTVVMVGNEEADFDLYAKWNSPPTAPSEYTVGDYDAASCSTYSSEYFTVTGHGTLYVMVQSYYGKGNWRCNVLAGKPSVDSGRKVGTLNAAGETATYSIAGKGYAWVYLSGPDFSDFDLYIKWNSPPTTTSYDDRGYTTWSQEICKAKGSGTLYYMVRSYSGKGEYTMVALTDEFKVTLSIAASSGGTTNPAPGTYTYSYVSSVSVSASAYSGYTFSYWLLDGTVVYNNPITVTMNSDHTLQAYFSYSGGGGGGGCPILYAYNGTEYVREGLLDIHNPDGIDVVYNHTLVTTPQRVDDAYLFRLVEHPQTHSYIDQVKLYAILEDKSVVGLPLIWAWHSEYGNVLPQLLFSDEWKTDTLGANLNNGTSQSIDLKFAALNPNMKIIGFVFQIEGNNMIVKV